jgi:hypothetical protein
LGIHEDSNRSVSKEVNEAFQSESVWPRQVLVEEEINNQLIDRIFGWDDILFVNRERDPRRTQDQADTMDKNLKSGRQSINEQRAEMGYPPIKGGDVYFIMSPTGIVVVENLPDMAEQQLAAGDPIQAAGGIGSTGQASPKAPQSAPLTRRQADAVSQRE